MREVADRFIAGRGRRRAGAARRRPAELGHRDRADGLPRAVRARRRAGRRRRRRRRAAALRRTAAERRRRPSSRRLLRPDRAHRRHPRDADHARGDLRPGAADHRRRLRGRGGRAGQRLATSASAPRSGPPTAAAGERIARELEAGMVWINDHMFSHGACQCSWGGVKESGLGPHPLQVRPVRVRQRQAARLGALDDPRPLVASRTTRRSAGRCARPRRSSTGARRSGPRRCARARRRCSSSARGSPATPCTAGSATLQHHARPGLCRQGMRLPAPQGDLRPVVRPGHARDAVLHRLPAAEGPALPGRRRGRDRPGEGRGPARLRRRRDAGRARGASGADRAWPPRDRSAGRSASTSRATSRAA